VSWRSQFFVPHASGRLVVDGQLVTETGAGARDGRFVVAPGGSTIELQVAGARGAGQWVVLFETAGLGDGGLRLVSGEAAVTRNAIVLQSAGQPDQRAIVTLHLRP
jgi:hypothetical protein